MALTWRAAAGAQLVIFVAALLWMGRAKESGSPTASVDGGYVCRINPGPGSALPRGTKAAALILQGGTFWWCPSYVSRRGGSLVAAGALDGRVSREGAAYVADLGRGGVCASGQTGRGWPSG